MQSTSAGALRCLADMPLAADGPERPRTRSRPEPRVWHLSTHAAEPSLAGGRSRERVAGASTTVAPPWRSAATSARVEHLGRDRRAVDLGRPLRLGRHELLQVGIGRARDGERVPP